MAKRGVAVRRERTRCIARCFEQLTMAESVNVPIPESIPAKRNGSAWAPLGEPLFRSLWIAAVISYTGTWMQNVGAGWLMTQLTMSPLMVSLVQAAATLPVFLVILPAGALADMMDRRRVLFVAQAGVGLAVGLFGVFEPYCFFGSLGVLFFSFF